MGRVTKEWLKFRKQYLKDHPPNHEQYYICAICGKWVHESEVTLDHKLNRSTHPHLRLDPTNIQFAHAHCNSNKKLKP